MAARAWTLAQTCSQVVAWNRLTDLRGQCLGWPLLASPRGEVSEQRRYRADWQMDSDPTKPPSHAARQRLARANGTTA
eukprot:7578804-Alexandrium_andersonii.AAC.1